MLANYQNKRFAIFSVFLPILFHFISPIGYAETNKSVITIPLPIHKKTTTKSRTKKRIIRKQNITETVNSKDKKLFSLPYQYINNFLTSSKMSLRKLWPSNNKATKQLNEAYTKEVAKFFNISPKSLKILPIKAYQQTEEYTCGPAALMTLLHYYGKLPAKAMNPKTELRIAKELRTSAAAGTSQKKMVNWLTTHGFKVFSGMNGSLNLLRLSLKQGIPVLVHWIDWGGHWVIFSGYYAGGKSVNDDEDLMFFADPSALYTNVQTINNLTIFNPNRFTMMWFTETGENKSYIIAIPSKKPNNIFIRSLKKQVGNY